MKRFTTDKRPDWEQKCEEVGFDSHTAYGEPYWEDGVYYQFSLKQIEEIEKATYALQEMALEVVQNVIENNRFAELGIDPRLAAEAVRSWNNDEESLYGRFDLVYDGVNPPKMFEYNADTPTTLLEAAVVQWQWLKDKFPEADQFNRLHDALLENLKYFREQYGDKHLYFAYTQGAGEDYDTVRYMVDVAVQAGFNASILSMDQVGLDGNQFVDAMDRSIEHMFKLYPWEWMAKETFFEAVSASRTQWLEPAWKCILSTKACLPIFSELFPDSPYLLKASFSPLPMDCARKQVNGREGNGITLYKGDIAEHSKEGIIESAMYVYQERRDVPNFDGHYPVIGSWIIGDEAAGIGIRENTNPITTNLSLFVPHIIKG